MSPIRYLHLLAETPPSALSTSPFKCMFVADRAVSTEWRNEIAEWIVRSGCLYFVAWGEDCEGWHDSVDDANLCEFGWGTIPDDRFVMTTWHQKDTLAEAMWFAAHAAEHPTVELANTIIVHVGDDERGDELLDVYWSALST